MSAEGHPAQNHWRIDGGRGNAQRLLNLGEITAVILDVAAFRHPQPITRERPLQEFGRRPSAMR